MLFLNKPKATFSSLGQDSEDDAERDGMLEKIEYADEKATPKSRRFWSSNIPWICSTVLLLVYIITTSLYQRKAHELWSPTDMSTHFLYDRNVGLRCRTCSAVLRGIDVHIHCGAGLQQPEQNPPTYSVKGTQVCRPTVSRDRCDVDGSCWQ